MKQVINNYQAFRTMMDKFDTLDIRFKEARELREKYPYGPYAGVVRTKVIKQDPIVIRKQKLKSWWDVRKNRDKVMMACMALFALAIILAVLKRDALMSNPIQAVQEMGFICVKNMSVMR